VHLHLTSSQACTVDDKQNAQQRLGFIALSWLSAVCRGDSGLQAIDLPF